MQQRYIGVYLLQFDGIVPSICLSNNVLSLATTSETSSTEDQETVKRYEVFMYNISSGTLEELTVSPTAHITPHVQCHCITQHFDSGHTRPMTSVLHCLGMVATASTDGSVVLHSLGSNCKVLSVLDRHSSAITDVQYSGNTLVVAKGNVDVWTAVSP